MTAIQNKKVVLICGAGSEIGKQLVTDYAAQDLVVLALSRKPPNQTHEGLVRHIYCDFSSPDSIATAFGHVVSSYNSIDVAIHCQGCSIRTPDLSHSREEWDLVIQVTLASVWQCIQEEIKFMKSRRTGSIVNIASVASFKGNPWGEAPYIAAKHGVVGLTRALAYELGPVGIRVNAVCPSFFPTDANVNLFGEFREQKIEALRAQHPLQRLITPKDISRAVKWLGSDDAAAITGIALPIDAGLLVK